MAPKGKSAEAKAKSSSSRRRSSGLATALPSTSVNSEGTLADTLHVDEAKAAQERSSRRVLKKQSTDVMVDRSIRGNFRSFTPAEVDGKLVGGLTLRQKLTEDKRDAKNNPDSEVKFGKKYFQQLREAYGEKERNMAELVVANPDDVVSAEMKAALSACRQPVPNRSSLLSCLQTANMCNQKELAGLLRFTMDSKPHLGNHHQTIPIEVIRYLVRNNADSRFPKEMELFRPFADRVLSQALINMKNSGIPLSSFWALYRNISHFVVPTEKVDQLLAVKGTWDSHSDLLEEVASNSELGEKMFGFAVAQNLSSRLAKKIDEKIVEALGGGKVTKEVVERAVEKVKTEVDAMPGVKRVVQQRAICIKYRGQELMLDAGSVHEEITLRVAAVVKSLAIGFFCQGSKVPVLTPLWCETELFQDPKGDQEVDTEVVKVWNVARSSCNCMLATKQHGNSMYIVDMLDKKFDVLTQMDATFKLEAAFFQMMALQGGAKMLQQRVLDILPGAPGEHSANETAAKLENLKKVALYSFCGAESLGSVNLVYELVHSIAIGRLPTIAACKGSQFKETVGHRLSFFAFYRRASNSNQGEVEILSGSDAMNEKFRQVEEKFRQNASVLREDLKPFHVFNWLLSPAQQAQHAKWVAKIFGGSSVSASAYDKKKASLKKGSQGVDNQPSAKKAKKLDKTDEVDDLFA